MRRVGMGGLVGALLLVACGSGNTQNIDAGTQPLPCQGAECVPADAGPVVTPTPDAGTADAGVPDAGQADAGLPPPPPPPPPPTYEVQPGNAALQLIGRFDVAAVGGPVFSWPGSEIALSFTGPSLSVTLNEFPTNATDHYGNLDQNAYAIFIDSAAPVRLTTHPGMGTYEVATGLGAGTHKVRIIKRTESFVGEAQLVSLTIGPGGAPVAPAPRTRKLQFIGDSITAGYGVEGLDETCGFSSATENYTMSYAFVLAEALSAKAISTAYSGIGVWRNDDLSTDPVMPTLFERTRPDQSAPLWDQTLFVPDVVVINLGTNDFSGGDPGADFVSNYHWLLDEVRAVSPNALIVLTLGPMISDDYPAGGNHLTLARTYLQTVISERDDSKIILVEFPIQDGALGYGCDWHPSALMQRKMAEQLQTAIKAKLGW